MFIIARKPTLVWPVRISLPIDGGDSQQIDTRIEFQRLPEADYQALLEQHKQPEGAGLSEVLVANAAILARIVADWPDLADEDGRPLAYSVERLASLIAGPDGLAISQALFGAYAEIRYGGRQKN